MSDPANIYIITVLKPITKSGNWLKTSQTSASHRMFIGNAQLAVTCSTCLTDPEDVRSEVLEAPVRLAGDEQHLDQVRLVVQVRDRLIQRVHHQQRVVLQRA